MAGRNWKKEVGPFTAMASVESATVIINTLIQNSYSERVKLLCFRCLFLHYRHSYSAPSSLYISQMRRSELPSFKMSVLYRIVVVALVGYQIQFNNSFICYEQSHIHSYFCTGRHFQDGKSEAVKLINSSENHRHHAFNIRCIDGSLHKGPTIISSASSSPSPRSPPSLQYPLETTQTNGITGGLLLVLQSLFSSIWYILQGVFGPSYDALLSTRVVHLKGPPYASIFKPFSIAIAAAFSVKFLGDSLFLGSVLGATILLVGFLCRNVGDSTRRR